MPVEVFRARELDIQKGEAAIEYAAKLEGIIEELRNRLMVLESNLTQERRATDATVGSLQLSVEKYKRRAKSPGLGVGFGWSSADEWAAIVGLVWKLDGLVP